MNNKPFDLILFGATGFTGTLVAEYLYGQYPTGLKWAIAGRNREKLDPLAKRFGGIPVLLADVSDLDSLKQLAAQAKVVCSTVGPYSLYGSPVVEACVDQGAHYCDLTGEVPWIRKMIDQHHQRAAEKGLKIVHCCGFDSIPSDLGVHFLQQHIKRETGKYCTTIKMRVKGTRGGLSGGTYASMKAVVASAARDPQVGALLFNPYALNPNPNFKGADGIDFMGVGYDAHFKAYTAPFIMASINTRVVRRSHALLDYAYGENFKYEEAMLTGRGFSAKLKAKVLTAVIKQMSSTKSSMFKNIVDRIMPASGEGPSAQQRERGFFNLGMLGISEDQQIYKAKITGDRDPGYGSTAKMLGESAVCLALDNLPQTAGVITPSVAMGDQLLTRLPKNAGVKFQIESTD